MSRRALRENPHLAGPRRDGMLNGRKFSKAEFDRHEHHRFRNRRFRFFHEGFWWADPWWTNSYAYGACNWVYRNAVATGSPYWWNRYYGCINYAY
jgi:hypothetical protein